MCGWILPREIFSSFHQLLPGLHGPWLKWPIVPVGWDGSWHNRPPCQRWDNCPLPTFRQQYCWLLPEQQGQEASGWSRLPGLRGVQSSGPVGTRCSPVCAGWNLAMKSGMVCVHSSGPVYWGADFWEWHVKIPLCRWGALQTPGVWAASSSKLAPREAGHPVPCNTCCSSLNGSVAIPMGYDRDKCQAVFNKETCTYTVLEKKNPLKNCTVTAWVL